MLNNRIFYRNNSWGGSGVTSIKDVLFFEVDELENYDFFNEVQLFVLGEDAVELTADNTTEELLLSLVKAIETRLQDILGVANDKEVYGVWLATRGSLIDNYEGEEERSSYLIAPGHGLVLFNSQESDQDESFDIFAATKLPYNHYEI